MSQTAGATPKSSTLVPWLALALILGILASAIFVVMRHLRTVIVDQIARQDGYVLYAASKIQIDPEFATDPELRLVAIENKALEAALLLTNIIAMRLFDSTGEPQFVFPENVRTVDLSAMDFAKAREFKLASEYQANADLSSIFEELPREGTMPLLRVIVPVQFGANLIGVAEFLIDGRNVEASLVALNQGLWRYGLVIFAVGGGITALSLVAAFGRLQKANSMLAQRTASLLRANHELTLAAKTSAVGAITAHLIHDLKSPLFGLQSFVEAKGTDAGGDHDDWNLALSTTQRMQAMIGDVVRILQEEKTADYELTVEESLALLRGKVEPHARERGVRLVTEILAEADLANRDANIVLMVLTNLVQNALHATPSGGEIRVTATKEGADLLFEVADTGPGLPESVRAMLFSPSRSTKTGGTGLGLAISKQLANHAGAELTLKTTSEAGTTFQLRLPARTEAGTAEEGRKMTSIS
jgi:signal transduction histidine kinase